MRAGVRRLEDAGIDEPGHDVRLLMLDAFGGSAAELIAVSAAAAPDDVQRRFAAALERRAVREPVQHILGWAGFYGLDLICDRRALIPRPDSESIVEAVLALAARDQPIQIADLGTGSGCLLLAALANLPAASGTGVEASPDAAALARENIAACGLADRASVFEGGWADWPGWSSVDVVISNPPYIPTGDIAGLEPEVRAFDPLAALDGGPDGLAAYRDIIAIAACKMKPGTHLVLEIGHDQRAAVEGLLSVNGFVDLGARGDLGGHDRCVWGRRP